MPTTAAEDAVFLLQSYMITKRSKKTQLCRFREKNRLFMGLLSHPPQKNRGASVSSALIICYPKKKASRKDAKAQS